MTTPRMMRAGGAGAGKGADRPAARPAGLPPFLKLWFALDAALALAPPLYWLADGRTWPILGVPAAFFYSLAVEACIAASIVVAHLVERGAAERLA